ncbi:MAG: helix-hairpin-helix domain-containing protein [Bacteroidota bacterium]
MIKKLLREIYMLPRGEQRALIVLSFLLILSVLIRIGVQLLPGREPAGMEEFEKEYNALMAALARADSIADAASGSHRSPITVPQSPITVPQSPITVPQSPININRADSAQLLPLPGIGPVFAGRIIKYRNLLGGFVMVEQLSEVYGMKPETLDLISDRIVIDTSVVRKIRIDSASFRDLLRHPYLDLDEVKTLVEYRDFKKDITSLGELRENHILEDSTLERIGPYFELGK